MSVEPKRICKVWIDAEKGDHVKRCRVGFESANMEHGQIPGYLAHVFAKGFPYVKMTINIQDLGELPALPVAVLTNNPSGFEDMDE